MTNQPPHILIVDDDPTLIEMYRTRLVAEGYSVELAHDGQEALAKAVEHTPDIILCDMRMPNVTGLEVLEILKTTTSTKNVPVVILTAFNDDELRQQAMARGAAGYLVKSETMPAQIIQTVKTILKIS